MAEKRYRGAPFGTQTARFDVSGIHPQSKMPGSYTQVSYCKKATSKENQLLGPGTYAIDTGDFTERAVTAKSLGPNWERAYDLAKFHAIPHMLYRDKWEHQKEMETLMGPGRYEHKDFITTANEKPSSYRGVCQTCDRRFPRENKFQSNIPGPGTYGDGGIPWTAAEKKSRESMSRMGMLESSGRDYYTKTIGSGLAPCRYTYPSCTDQLLNKTISLRGPYDLFSIDRYKCPRDLVEKKFLGPGKYDLKSFTKELNDPHCYKHGLFSSLQQYPELPTERIYCSTLSQFPRNKYDPGPGHYAVSRTRIHSAPPITARYPFDSSAKRFDRRSEVFFNGNTNPVGVGQYDLNRWHRYQHKNGNVNIFISKTPRLPPKVDAPRELLLNERIHPKRLHTGREFCEPVIKNQCNM